MLVTNADDVDEGVTQSSVDGIHDFDRLSAVGFAKDVDLFASPVGPRTYDQIIVGFGDAKSMHNQPVLERV